MTKVGRLTYRTQEVAKLLGYSLDVMHWLAKEDKIPGRIRLGETTLWHKATIDYYVNEYHEPRKQLRTLRRLISDGNQDNRRPAQAPD